MTGLKDRNYRIIAAKAAHHAELERAYDCSFPNQMWCLETFFCPQRWFSKALALWTDRSINYIGVKNGNYMVEIDWQFSAKVLVKIQNGTIGKNLSARHKGYITVHRPIIGASGGIINYIMYDSGSFLYLKNHYTISIRNYSANNCYISNLVFRSLKFYDIYLAGHKIPH